MNIIAINHTFVVCAYKESQFLSSCINSLLVQQESSDIIIATSTPNKYIQKIAKRHNLKLFENVEAKNSIGSDWNFALSCVKTPYATIIHQDDIYLPGFAKATLGEISKKNCLIAFTNYSEIKNDVIIKPTVNLRIKNIMLLGFRIFKNSRVFRRVIFSFGCPICCPAVTYNLTALNEFKFDNNLKVSLDWDAWIRIGSNKGRFGYVSKRLIQHRIHEDSETTNAIKNNSRSTEDYKIFRRFWPKFIAKKLSKVYNKSQDTN